MPNPETIRTKVGWLEPLTPSQLKDPHEDQMWRGSEYGATFRVVIKKYDFTSTGFGPRIRLEVSGESTNRKRVVDDFSSLLGEPRPDGWGVDDYQHYSWECIPETTPQGGLIREIRKLFIESEESYKQGKVEARVAYTIASTLQTDLRRISSNYPRFSKILEDLGNAFAISYSFIPKTGRQQVFVNGVKTILRGVVADWDTDAKALLARLLIARSFVGKTFYANAEANAMMKEMEINDGLQDAEGLDFDTIIRKVLEGKLKLVHQTP
jgi:hypothetical protein